MNNYLTYLLHFSICMLITQNVYSQKKTMPFVKWQTVAKLQNKDYTPSIGFAGTINGFTNTVLIVAGGANFPDKMPWEQGKKHYSKSVQILQKVGSAWQWSKNNSEELPEPIAYCGNTVTTLGIVYAGGENENGLSDKAYLLNWNIDKNKLIIKSLPNLPKAISNITLTSIGNVVYAVGGDFKESSSDQFLRIDLEGTNPKWETLPHLPIALANSTTIAQQKGVDHFIYVVGGRTKNKNGISDLHHSTYAFDIKNKVWKSMAPISDGKQITNLSAAAGIAIGEHYILIAGGDNGKVFHQIEVYLNQISNAQTEAEKTKLTVDKNKLVINHQGFYRGILVYNTLTNRWIKIGELPFLTPVTTTATKDGNSIILANGEIKPGIRTPDINIGEFNLHKL